MSDWANTPIKQRLNATQVKVVDTDQDAFVGADDSAYYTDVMTNASELAPPSAPSTVVFTDGTDSTAEITWTDVAPNSDTYNFYYALGSFNNPEVIIANGTRHPTPLPAGTTIAAAPGTYSIAIAGINEFGVGDYAIVIDIITQI